MELSYYKTVVAALLITARTAADGETEKQTLN